MGPPPPPPPRTAVFAIQFLNTPHLLNMRSMQMGSRASQLTSMPPKDTASATSARVPAGLAPAPASASVISASRLAPAERGLRGAVREGEGWPWVQVGGPLRRGGRRVGEVRGLVTVWLDWLMGGCVAVGRCGACACVAGCSPFRWFLTRRDVRDRFDPPLRCAEQELMVDEGAILCWGGGRGEP